MILKNEFRIKYLIPVGNNISEKARKSLIDSFKNDFGACSQSVTFTYSTSRS